MKLLLLLTFTWAQTLVSQISDTQRFEAEWAKRAKSGSITKYELEKWAEEIWGSKLTPENKDKFITATIDGPSQNIARLDSKTAYMMKVDNSESIKEVARIYLLLQAAYAECPDSRCPDQQRVQIEKYNAMLRHLLNATSGYHYSKSDQLMSGKFDLATVKSKYGSEWNYTITYRPSITVGGSASSDMASEDDLVRYNKVYCECVMQLSGGKQLNVDRLKKCAAESIDERVMPVCQLSMDPGAQPRVENMLRCREPKTVFIFPAATSFFVNNSCTLDLGRARSFLGQGYRRMQQDKAGQ